MWKLSDAPSENDLVSDRSTLILKCPPGMVKHIEMSRGTGLIGEDVREREV